MASKMQTPGHDKGSTEQRSPKPAAGYSAIVAQQQTHPAAIIQRARLAPNSLTANDVLQLQRTIGNQAVGRLLAQVAQRQPVQGVVQRLRGHAISYAASFSDRLGFPKGAGKVKVDLNKESVKTYVDNAGNDREKRLGLLRAWNKGQNKSNAIPTPPDLVPKKVEMKELEDLSGWNSEAEDEIDISEVISKKRRRNVTIVRGDGRKVKAPVLGMFDVIRLGRQIVKRDKYDFLPLVAQIGPIQVEYDNPGTKDVYATPLTPLKEADTFKRAGASKDFNFENLTSKLEKEGGEPPQKKRRLQNIFGTFSGDLPSGGVGEAESEAIGAISCDFMKGSSAITFVQEAKTHIEKVGTFAPFFTGSKPLYRPAATGGRRMVSELTRAKREVLKSGLLGMDDCLVNAIALAALKRKADLNELARIRKQLGSIDEMLAASSETIRIIKEVLKIAEAIVVHYKTKSSFTVGDSKSLVHIYNIDDATHFVHECPEGYV